MPETPIKTDTGVHPFDEDEFIGIQGAIIAWNMSSGYREEERPNLADYAAAVMPAMAEKIRQLRGLLNEERRRTLDEVLARFETVGDGAAVYSRHYVQGWLDAVRTVERMRET